MNEPTLHDISQRLDRVERENLRLKREGAVATLGIAAIVLMGQGRPAGRMVEAERFVLRDPSGKLRAQLGVAAGSTPRLTLVDRDGKLRARLGLLADGAPILALVDRNGKITWSAP